MADQSGRGYYGNVDSQHEQKPGGWGTVAIVVGIAAGIYLLSPGMRYYYKHGQLPELDVEFTDPETGQPLCHAR